MTELLIQFLIAVELQEWKCIRVSFFFLTLWNYKNKKKLRIKNVFFSLVGKFSIFV